MKKYLLRPCPICQNTSGEILHSQKFILPAHYPLPNVYDIVCCNYCGFVYADTSASQSDYDYFYAELSKYQDLQTSTGGGYFSFDEQRLQDTAKTIDIFLQDKNKRILDIGCANGGLLAKLQNLGYNNLSGVDPSLVCVQYIQKNYNISSYLGSIFSNLDYLGKFDCIILSHVLEHLQDLKTAICNVVNLLSEQGILYIEVPNASEYKNYVKSPFQDFNTEHINHFNHQNLINLLTQFDLTLQKEEAKILQTAKDNYYPAIYQIWQKYNEKNIVNNIVYSGNLKEKIVSYIEKSQTILNKIEGKIRPLIEDKTEILVWGTGQLAMKLLAETSLSQANIKAFIDANPINHGKCLLGIEILLPDAIKSMRQPILIASLLHQQVITECIRTYGEFYNDIITLI